MANIDSAVSKSGHLEQGLTDPSGSAFVIFPCWASIGPLLMWFSREINIFYLFFMYQFIPYSFVLCTVNERLRQISFGLTGIITRLIAYLRYF